MSKYTRYLFGYSRIEKADVDRFIRLKPASYPPTGEIAIGVLYHNGNTLQLCNDGTNFLTVSAT